MKRIILLSLLGISLVSNAQEQEDIAKFKISEAKINGTDVTQYYFDRKQYFVFYLNEEKQICLANVSGTTDDQSYGKIYSLKSENRKETETTFEAEIYNFRWKYFNSYNDQSGYATIEFTKIYKPAGVTFTIKMVAANLDVCVYTGYMEGSLNLKEYLD